MMMMNKTKSGAVWQEETADKFENESIKIKQLVRLYRECIRLGTIPTTVSVWDFLERSVL